MGSRDRDRRGGRRIRTPRSCCGAHDRSEATAHEGRFSEHFAFEAKLGSVLYYSYDVPRAPIVEGLKATLYARSNRPGVQLFGVVILPEDRDPDREAATMVLVPGTSVDTADRWQRLELSGIARKVEEQARVIRASTGRPVRLKGAYLQRLVVNLYGGGGSSEVFLDELSLSPVPTQAPPEAGEVEAMTPLPDHEPGAAEAAERVKIVGTRLTNNGQPWFPFLVSAPGADVETLRRANFDVLAVPPETDPHDLARAVEHGFLLMPVLDAAGDVDAERAAATAGTFRLRESVAFWDLGQNLGAVADAQVREVELERVRRLIESIHDLPEGGSRLTTGTIAGMFPAYGLFGNNLDLMGVEIDAPGRMEDPIDTYRYLSQRRDLTATSNPNGVFLAWVPARSSQVIRTAVWGVDVPPEWGWPQVSPDLMRLYAYTAVSAGYRGLGFRGDAGLSRPVGLPRLYEASLLIGELALVEPILARGTGQVTLWKAFPPNPKPKLQYDSSGGASAGFSSMGRSNNRLKQTSEEVKPLASIKVAMVEWDDTRTKLLVATDLAGGAQWQPPQMASREVNLLVPAPESAQAFEISLGGVKKLDSQRDAGGRRIILPTFNTTALVLLTTDLSQVDPIRQQALALSPRAADIAIKQAELQLREVETIHGMLVVPRTDGPRRRLAAQRGPADPPVGPRGPRPTGLRPGLVGGPNGRPAAPDADARPVGSGVPRPREGHRRPLQDRRPASDLRRSGQAETPASTRQPGRLRPPALLADPPSILLLARLDSWRVRPVRRQPPANRHLRRRPRDAPPGRLGQ